MGWWIAVSVSFDISFDVDTLKHHAAWIRRLTAQLIGPHTHRNFVGGPALHDVDLVVGQGRSQYASFSWEDFKAIAPWMEEKITKIIFGPGLGN
jgi:hypothetical protein